MLGILFSFTMKNGFNLSLLVADIWIPTTSGAGTSSLKQPFAEQSLSRYDICKSGPRSSDAALYDDAVIFKEIT